ncbi:MAG: hypothetical protein PHP01_00630, partial [Phycisphaerae bacterium]|nr:hypothetical protein [Phycisphaerae bacterium]
MRKTGFILLVLAGVLLGAECAFSQDSNAVPEEQKAYEPEQFQDANEVVMAFDGKKITVGYLRNLAPQLTPETVKEVADYWLEVQLLYEEAIKQGLDKDTKTKSIADMEYKKAFASAIMRKVVDKVNITSEQVKRYYNKNQDTDKSLWTMTYLSFSHIMVDDLETAEEVLKKLNEG